jgi:hypothetical protein
MAHEIAHLVQGRARGWPVALVATIILWAVAITVVTMALYDGAPDDQWGDLSLAAVIALLAWRTSVTPQRRAEYQPTPTPSRSSVVTTFSQRCVTCTPTRLDTSVPSRPRDLRPIPHPGSGSVMYGVFDPILVQPSVSSIVAGRMRSLRDRVVRRSRISLQRRRCGRRRRPALRRV